MKLFIVSGEFTQTSVFIHLTPSGKWDRGEVNYDIMENPKLYVP